MSTQKFITDPESVRLSRIGELKIDGKPALNLASDMRSASRPVFSHLAHNYPDLLAVAAGMGLSVKGSNGEYRRISRGCLKSPGRSRPTARTRVRPQLFGSWNGER